MGSHNLPYEFERADFKVADPGAGGALPNTLGYAAISLSSDAAEARSLAAPIKAGQILTLSMIEDNGDVTVTTATAYDETGGTTLVFSAVGEYVDLKSVEVSPGTYAWRVIAFDGVAGPTVNIDDLVVADDVTVNGDLTVVGNVNHNSAAVDYVVIANTAAALEFSDGTTKLLTLDTRNTIADVNGVTITSPATTVATAVAAHQNPSLKLANKTITYTGTATVTSQLGGMLNVGVLTLTDASAGTVSLASAIHINAVAAAGGMLTLTAARMISTSVSDCYLTNAGVWTDTMCWESGKNDVAFADDEEIDSLIDGLTPHKWRYKPEVHGDDGVERLGIMYDELPQALTLPGAPNADGRRGVSPGLLASFSLAAIRALRDRNRFLESRVAALEAA